MADEIFPQELAPPPQPALPNKVLLVDDVAFNRLIVARSLEGLGYRVTGVASAGEGLTALHTGNFDVVVTDLMMPVMDGVQFFLEAQKYKKMTDTGLVGPPPFVVLTADTNMDHLRRAVMAGIKYVIPKPFDPAKGHQIIQKAIAEK